VLTAFCRQSGVGAAVVNFDNSGIRNQRDFEVALESAQQGGGSPGIVLQGIGKPGWLFGERCVLGALVEIQLPDDLQGQQVTLQNAYFGVEVGGVIVVHDGTESLKVMRLESALFGGDAANRLIDRGLAEAGEATAAKMPTAQA